MDSLLVPTIGASGAIYGVMLAVAMVMPHRQVYLFPLPVTISMRWMVIVMGAIEFFGDVRTADGVTTFATWAGCWWGTSIYGAGLTCMGRGIIFRIGRSEG